MLSPPFRSHDAGQKPCGLRRGAPLQLPGPCWPEALRIEAMLPPPCAWTMPTPEPATHTTRGGSLCVWELCRWGARPVGSAVASSACGERCGELGLWRALWGARSVGSAVASSVCGERCGELDLWGARSVGSSICGELGLWGARSVGSSVCGELGLWGTPPVGMFADVGAWPVGILAC